MLINPTANPPFSFRPLLQLPYQFLKSLAQNRTWVTKWAPFISVRASPWKEKNAGRLDMTFYFLWVSIYLMCIFLQAFTAVTPHQLTTPPLPLSYFSFFFVTSLSYCHAFQTISLRRLALLSSSFSSFSKHPKATEIVMNEFKRLHFL